MPKANISAYSGTCQFCKKVFTDEYFYTCTQLLCQHITAEHPEELAAIAQRELHRISTNRVFATLESGVKE